MAQRGHETNGGCGSGSAMFAEVKEGLTEVMEVSRREVKRKVDGSQKEFEGEVKGC